MWKRSPLTPDGVSIAEGIEPRIAMSIEPPMDGGGGQFMGASIGSLGCEFGAVAGAIDDELVGAVGEAVEGGGWRG